MNPNSIRIVKNTLFLYIRQFIITLVSLYTVRAILLTLGADDFGIYTIVAGVVVLFSFLDSAMTTAAQRFLNFSLGEKNIEQTRDVFNISFVFFIFLSILIIVFAETVGLLIFYKILNIPAERQQAAFIVYQLSIILTIFNLLRIPYHATIIANEKMSFFALISIIESILRLSVVFLLILSPIDNLVSYAFLLLSLSICIFFVYKIYCNKSFSFARFRLCKDKILYKKFIEFSSWSFIGSIANMTRGQGINIILNMFHGVMVNAAMGIATQINTAVYQFVNNFQLAFKPQIIKSYAAKDYNYFMRLIFQTSKLSFVLLFLFVLPVLLNTEYILQLWLKNVPNYTVVFTQLILIYSLIEATSGSIYFSVQAYGNIRKHQIIFSMIIILTLPISFIILSLGYKVEYVLLVKIITNLTANIWRLFYIRKIIDFPLIKYLYEVIIPIVFISVISCFLSYFTSYKLFDLYKLIVSFTVSSLSIISLFYFFGLTINEKENINKYIKGFLKKH